MFGNYLRSHNNQINEPILINKRLKIAQWRHSIAGAGFTSYSVWIRLFCFCSLYSIKLRCFMLWFKLVSHIFNYRLVFLQRLFCRFIFTSGSNIPSRMWVRITHLTQILLFKRRSEFSGSSLSFFVNEFLVDGWVVRLCWEIFQCRSVLQFGLQ